MAHRVLLKNEVKAIPETKHKEIAYVDLGESENSKRVFEVTLPGGHSFRVEAVDEAGAKAELDKVIDIKTAIAAEDAKKVK